MAEIWESTVYKTALLFEGGSMRGAYTAAVAAWLLEQGVYFDRVYGVSSGSSNTVNYLSRDIWRVKEAFTDAMGKPGVGNAWTMLQHKGIFNAHYIYQEAARPDGILPYNFEAFQKNPADLCIPALDRDTGEELYFTKKDMPTLDDLMIRVRASSTIPAFMPPPTVEGRVCYDGGFCVGGGLPLLKMEADGFERVVVLRTQKRGYRKTSSYAWAKQFFWRRPAIRDAMLSRGERYNQACDLLDEWEKSGRAFVFYPEDLTLKGSERDVALFHENYNAGYAQIQREGSDLLRFVEAGE